MKKISLDEKFVLFDEHWRPKTVAALNGQEVKLVKVKHMASERVDLEIQRDATTEERRARFLDEYRGRSALDLL